MRVMHLADLHLGFRAYNRLTKQGSNQREADVALTFTRVIDLVIARAPDLVIVGGDVFHHAKPSNTAIVVAMQEFMRLREALPDTIVVIAAGNHDTPRTSEMGSILPLYEPLGIHIADARPKRFYFPERDLAVLAVPDANYARPVFDADPRATINVCVAHLEVAGMLKGAAGDGRRALEVPLAEMAVEQFGYVGCGHYHVFRQLAPNATYAGSIDYTSTDIWGELREATDAGLPGKTIVERDLETGEQTLHPVPASRFVADLPPIDAMGMLSADLNRAIIEQAESVALEGAIVRQVVHNCDPLLWRERDYRAIRGFEAAALHYQLVHRKPEPKERAAGARRQLLSIEDLLRGKLEERARSGEMDPAVAARLVATGTDYLERAAAMESEKRGEPTFTTAGETPADAAA